MAACDVGDMPSSSDNDVMDTRVNNNTPAAAVNNIDGATGGVMAISVTNNIDEATGGVMAISVTNNIDEATGA